MNEFDMNEYRLSTDFHQSSLGRPTSKPLLHKRTQEAVIFISKLPKVYPFTLNKNR